MHLVCPVSGSVHSLSIHLNTYVNFPPDNKLYKTVMWEYTNLELGFSMLV